MPRLSRALRAPFLLLLGIGLAGTPPAAAQVVPLEPAVDLAEPGQAHGYTTPGVALRPDGGYVAAWTNISTDQVVGSPFEPPAGGPVDLDLFELGPDDDTNFAPAVAHGADGAYLAVWPTGLLTEQTGLVARAFDGDGDPLGLRQSVLGGAVTSFAVAPRPTGGFVLAWWQDLSYRPSLCFRFLGPRGTPLGKLTVVTELENPVDTRATTVRVAASSDGDFVITWSWATVSEPLLASGAVAQGFTAQGAPLGDPVDLVDPPPPDRRVVEHDLAATGTGAFLMIYRQIEDPVSIPPSHEMLLLRFDPVDGAFGSVHRVDDGEPGIDRGSPALAVGSDGAGVAAWWERNADGPQILARLIDGNGLPRSDAFEVATLAPELDFVDGLGVDRDSEGRMVFGWGGGVESHFIPTDEQLHWLSQARRFLELGAECGPVDAVEFRTEPPQPAADDVVSLYVEGLAFCSEVSLLDWTLDGGTFRVEAEETGVEGCEGLPLLPFELALEAGLLEPRDYRVELNVNLEAGGTCSRAFGFTVEPSGETPPPPPPDRAPLTSEALAGFQVWVDITNQQGETVAGAAEEPCIPETLCVSGRLPGRSEVFVRVLGPRPNGRLWPVLVKFTTSRVEAWIEQLETGEVEYYSLRGARPGFDELPGLFDREGFEP